MKKFKKINNKLVDVSTDLFMEVDGELVANTQLFNLENIVPSALVKSKADMLLEEQEIEISQAQENQKDTTEINDDDFIKLEVAKSLNKMMERIESKNTSTEALKEFVYRQRDEEQLRQKALLDNDSESRLKTIELLSAIEAGRITLHKRYEKYITDTIKEKEQYEDRLNSMPPLQFNNESEKELNEQIVRNTDLSGAKKMELRENIKMLSKNDEAISKEPEYFLNPKIEELKNDYFDILLLEKQNREIDERIANIYEERFDKLLIEKMDEARNLLSENAKISDLQSYVTDYEKSGFSAGVDKEFVITQYDLGVDRYINNYADYLVAKEALLEKERVANDNKREMDEQDASFYIHFIRDFNLPTNDIQKSAGYLFDISQTLLKDQHLKQIAKNVDSDEFYKSFDKKLKELLKENYSKDEAFFGNLLARKNARATIFESDASLIRGDYNKIEDEIDTSSIMKEAVENQVNSVLDNIPDIANKIPADRATAEKIIKDAMDEYEKQVHLDRYSVDELAEAFKNTDYYKLFSALSKYERYDFIMDEEDKQNEETILKIAYDKVMDDDTITSLLNSEISEMLEEKIELAKENSSDLEKVALDIKNIPNLNNLSSDELAEAFTKTEYSKLFGALSLYEKPELFENISQESRDKILTEVYDEMMENDNITGLFNDEIATMIDEEIELFHEREIGNEVRILDENALKEFTDEDGDIDLTNLKTPFKISDNITEIKGDFNISGDCGIIEFPKNLQKIKGNLDISRNQNIKELNDKMTIGNLEARNCELKSLPMFSVINGYLNCSNTKFTDIVSYPSDLKVGTDIVLNNTNILNLPNNFICYGDLRLQNTPIKNLPLGLRVERNLELNHHINQLRADTQVNNEVISPVFNVKKQWEQMRDEQHARVKREQMEHIAEGVAEAILENSVNIDNGVRKEFVEKVGDEFIIKDTIVDKQANDALKEQFEKEVKEAILEIEAGWRENFLNVVSSVDGIKENYFNTSKRQLNEANIDYTAALSQEDKNTIYTIAEERILEKIIKERQEHNIEVFAEIDGWSDKTYSNAINKNSNLASIMLDKKLPHGLGNNPADELSTFWFNTCSNWYVNGYINKDEAKNIDIKAAVELTYKKERLTDDECGILSKFLAKNAIEFSENKPIIVDGDRNFVPSNALYKVAEGLNDFLKKQERKLLSEFLVKNMSSVFQNSSDVPDYLINRDGSAIFTRINLLHLKEVNEGFNGADKTLLKHVSNYLNDRKLSGLENHRNEYEMAFEICNEQVQSVLTEALKNIDSSDNFNDKLDKELNVLLKDYRIEHIKELLRHEPQDEFNKNYKEPTSLDEAEKRLAELTKYFSITDETGNTPLENAYFRVFNMPNTPVEFSDYKNYFDIKHEVELKRLEYDALNEYKSKAQENVSEIDKEILENKIGNDQEKARFVEYIEKELSSNKDIEFAAETNKEYSDFKKVFNDKLSEILANSYDTHQEMSGYFLNNEAERQKTFENFAKKFYDENKLDPNDPNYEFFTAKISPQDWERAEKSADNILNLAASSANDDFTQSLREQEEIEKNFSGTTELESYAQHYLTKDELKEIEQKTSEYTETIRAKYNKELQDDPSQSAVEISKKYGILAKEYREKLIMEKLPDFSNDLFVDENLVEKKRASMGAEKINDSDDEQKAKKAELNLVSLKASNEIYDIVMKSYNGDFVSSSEIKQIDSWMKENDEVIKIQATHGRSVKFGEGQVLRSLDLDFVLEVAEPLVKDIEKEKLWAFRDIYDTLDKFEKGEEVTANEVSEVKKWLSENKELIEAKVKDENNSHVRFIKDGTTTYVDTGVVIGLANALVKDKQVEIEKIKDSEIKVENSASETEKIKASGSKKRKNSSDELGLSMEQISINGYGLSAKEIERGKDYKSDGELVTGQISRVRRNIEALELSAKIQKENRFATKDEQKIMAGYTGWGGLTGVFGTANENLKAEAERLDKFLKENSANSIEYQQTYAAMSLSSQSAYYTSPLLIESIYKGLEQLGVADNGIAKKVLEPSCGVGNFMTNSQNSSFNFTGIEIEKASYNIAKQLNPNADIKHIGFERFNEKDNFDVVVGNPPYDNDIIIQDSTSLGDRLKIANYFPIKSMEQLRDGGVMAFVMPTGFLDKNSDGHLEKLCESGAEFLGAVRLPNTAFKNSGTEVNTDIVFFQKKAVDRKEVKELPSILNSNNMKNLGDREYEIIKKAFDLKEDKLSEDEKLEKNFETRSKEFYNNFSLSNYFVQNPQNILGKLEVETNRFGEYVPVIKDDGRDLKAELEKFINTLPKDIYKDVDRNNEIDNQKKFDFITHSDSFEYMKSLKNGNYFYDYTNNSFAKKLDDESYLLVSENDIWKNTLSKNMLDKYNSGNYDNKKRQKEIDILSKKLKDYIELRDTLNVVLKAELDETIGDEKLGEYRKNLNNTFDKMKLQYGQKEIKEVFKDFKDDLSYYLISTLENDGQKAKIFTERISTPISEPKVSTAKEALIASISMRGKIDLDYLDNALEQPLEKTIKELKDDKLIFVEPKTNEFVVAEKYLSGNVKKKYKEVMEYIEKTGDKSFEANADALKEVFPPDKKIQDISFGMAQSWIPMSVYEDFLDYYMKENHITGAGGRKPARIMRSYDGFIDFKRNYYAPIEDGITSTPFYEHYLKGKKEKTSHDYISYDDFKKRTPRYINDSDGSRWENDKRIALIDFALPFAFNNGKVAMMMADGYKTDEKGNIKTERDGTPIINYRFHKELTDDVMATISTIQENFIRYVLTNDHQRNIVEKAFNDTINTDRVRDFKSNELDLKGSNPDIKLRPHQVAGVWRGVQEKTTLLNVNVGGGKTFMGVALSMEQKRMCIINKTAIVAPKHLVGGWEKEYRTLYPNANILVLDEKSFDKKNRAKFLANVKLNDYDAVIMSKEQFQAIPKNPEKTLAKLAPEIEKYKEIERTSEGSREKKAASDHIKKLEKYAQKARKLADDLGKDKMTTFEELGFDCLIVDEAHNYKNLSYMTKKRSVAGLGSQSGSDIAFDMKMVTDDFNESNNKKLYFLTGTPVANSLCEIYHMQSFLQPQWLEEKGLTNFDKWANTFAKDVSDVELGAGGEPKVVTRMSDFVNLQALSSGWGNINFYANNDDIEKSAGDKFIPRAEIIKVVAPRSPALNHYYGEPDEKGEYPQGSLMWRFAHINEKENHPLRLTNLARKAALDYRMIDDNPANDFENSKINMVVKNVIDNYHNNHADEKSTQIIFCDLSVSKTALKDIKLDDDTPQKEAQPEPKEHHSDMVLKDKDGNVIQETYRITYLNGDVETYNINDFIEELKARNIELPKDLTKVKDLEEVKEGEFKMTGFAKVDMASENDKDALKGVTFDVYNDIAKKLMKSGIPREQIAFMGDYTKKEDKDALFEKMRNGDIRILIGSTAKMGTGMNVQDRLVALHNVDYPWNPAGFEQRIGRIERQGNIFYEKDRNFKPKVYNYSTERTYDVKALQLLESKAKAIHKFQEAHKLGLDTLEDVSQNAISFAEMKALTAGNPLIFEEFNIGNKLSKLEKEFMFWECNKIVAEKNIVSKEEKIEELKDLSTIYKKLSEVSKIADDNLNSRLGHLENPKEIIFSGYSYKNDNVYSWADNIEEDRLKNIIKSAREKFNDTKNNILRYSSGRHEIFDNYRGLAVGIWLNHSKNMRNEPVHQMYLRDTNGSYSEILVLPKVKLSSDYLSSKDFTLKYVMRKVDEVIEKMPEIIKQHSDDLQTLKIELDNSKRMVDSYNNEGFKEQKMLDALRSDKKEVVKHIKANNYDWIPRYKKLASETEAENSSINKNANVAENSNKEKDRE